MATEKVREIQDYLTAQGIKASETAIVDAAIHIATRWGGNWVFVCEFRKENQKEEMK